MGDDTDIGFGVIVGIGIFLLVIAIIIFSAVATIAATGGALWGGGTAIVNYGKSFKENMIDSNRAVSA